MRREITEKIEVPEGISVEISEGEVKIKKGDHVTVKYYGIRSPLLGLFPNVVRTMDAV